MATSIKEGLNYIIQAIQNMIEPQLDKLRYDRTYRAKVLEKVKDGVYRVQINGSEYQIKYNGNLNIGSVVKVKAPLNNFSDIYPETIPITNISELNNDSQFVLCFNNFYSFNTFYNVVTLITSSYDVSPSFNLKSALSLKVIIPRDFAIFFISELFAPFKINSETCSLIGITS